MSASQQIDGAPAARRTYPGKYVREMIAHFSNVHMHRLENGGKFPRRIKLGDRRIGYDADEVDAWYAAKKTARDAAA